MAARTVTYCASSGSDSTGDGSSGNPYATVAYALANITRDSTNGDRIRLSGTETLSATLPITSYGTPAYGADLVIDSWDDGPDGQGDFDLNGGAYYLMVLKSYVKFRGLKIHNCSNTYAVSISGINQELVDCELYDCTNAVICTYPTSRVDGNYIHDCTGYGIYVSSNGHVHGNRLENGTTKKFTTAISLGGGNPTATGNRIVIDGSTNGIFASGTYPIIRHNSIWSDGGTGYGIRSNVTNGIIQYNAIQGFSGTGGCGIYVHFTMHHRWNGNACYNNTTDYQYTDFSDYEDDNEDTTDLGGNLFDDPEAWDFTPQDRGNMLTGGLNGAAKGAMPAPSGGGGGGGGSLIGGRLIR